MAPARSPSSPCRSRPDASITVQSSLVSLSTATVIEASGRDRHGLLGDLAGAIARHGLSIQSAHIDNYGERAVDAFYVQDKGAKLAQRKAHALRSNLLEVLGEAESQAQPRGALSLERARASVGR